MKPDPERGSRFNIGAVVVNLSGTGGASRDMRWPGTPLATRLGVAERNLAGERADDLLTALEGRQWSRTLLPWIPLMTGGAGAGIIDRWKVLADGEPDHRTRDIYAGLALVLAEKANRTDVWKKALEGWNVTESTVVNEWKAEQAVTMLVAVLEAKFKTVPPEVEAAVRACGDLAKLQTWTTQAATTATLAEFRAAASI